MGHYTLIQGYIKSHRKYVEHNQDVLDAFEFDSVYPFPNGFGNFMGGGRCKRWAVAYATTVNNDDEETWLDWIQRFEELLAQMDGYMAEIRFESDREASVYVRNYSAIGDEKEVWEDWIREPQGHPAVAGIINFMDDEEAPEVSAEETS